MVRMMPVDYVNDPRVICQNDNVVSINSCVEVDLMGQVCSESVGLRQISAVGGQVDFVRGANMSKGGRHHFPLRCGLCGDRAWNRAAAWTYAERPGETADLHCGAGVP